MTDQTAISIAEIKKDIKHLSGKVEEQAQTSREILVALKGTNNEPGLTTRVCLLKQSVKRAWWFLSALSLCLLSIAGWVIKKALT
ncbi:MAG: hypothetical protein JRI58_14355 [Deltaproteobacteria bacterium]|nr:hypothetical protein [Deltaproteobacteria bacterium]